MVELSPLDILGTTFAKRLGGFDADQVRQFLNQVASAMETAVRDRGELRQRVHHLELELADYRERESALHDALVAAQRSAEATRDGARREAERIIQEAQTLADRLVDEATERARTVEVVIGDLRSRRRQARADLQRLVEVVKGLVSDDEQTERHERQTAQIAVLHRSSSRSSDGSA